MPSMNSSLMTRRSSSLAFCMASGKDENVSSAMSRSPEASAATDCGVPGNRIASITYDCPTRVITSGFSMNNGGRLLGTATHEMRIFNGSAWAIVASSSATAAVMIVISRSTIGISPKTQGSLSHLNNCRLLGFAVPNEQAAARQGHQCNDDMPGDGGLDDAGEHAGRVEQA